MSRGSSLRTFLAPHGDESRDSVAQGNKVVSRLLVYIGLTGLIFYWSSLFSNSNIGAITQVHVFWVLGLVWGSISWSPSHRSTLCKSFVEVVVDS